MRYHLVLEARPGDFMPVDINIISQDKTHRYDTIEEIDSYTKRFSLDEIMTMISDSNIVPFKYLDGKLHVINDNKYRYPVLLRTTDFSLDTFLTNHIEDKQIMNKFLNIYLKTSNSQKEKMKSAIAECSISKILHLLFELSYLDVRNIYTYLNANI